MEYNLKKLQQQIFIKVILKTTKKPGTTVKQSYFKDFPTKVLTAN